MDALKEFNKLMSSGYTAPFSVTKRNKAMEKEIVLNKEIQDWFAANPFTWKVERTEDEIELKTVIPNGFPEAGWDDRRVELCGNNIDMDSRPVVKFRVDYVSELFLFPKETQMDLLTKNEVVLPLTLIADDSAVYGDVMTLRGQISSVIKGILETAAHYRSLGSDFDNWWFSSCHGRISKNRAAHVASLFYPEIRRKDMIKGNRTCFGDPDDFGIKNLDDLILVVIACARYLGCGRVPYNSFFVNYKKYKGSKAPNFPWEIVELIENLGGKLKHKPNFKKVEE